MICATKGFDIQRLESVYTILKNHFSEKNLFVLSGPNIAKEINADLPAATVVAGKNFKAIPDIQKLLNTAFFRVYGSKDPVGVHLGGTFKNTYAIVAGIAHGLKLGDNAISAMMVRALAEMKLLALKMGANAGTLDGLSGAGDLMTTCYSILSRNHHVGIELAKGKKLNQILNLTRGSYRFWVGADYKSKREAFCSLRRDEKVGASREPACGWRVRPGCRLSANSAKTGSRVPPRAPIQKHKTEFRSRCQREDCRSSR
jgi:hypothetical protein